MIVVGGRIGDDAVRGREDFLYSRMYASLAVKSTQMLPAMPVRITRRTPKVSSKVSKVVSKNPECLGFSTK